MISLKLQAILIVMTLFFMVLLISMIRKYKLELKYALVWLFLCLLLVCISFFPNTINTLAQLTGIETPVNVLFLFGIISILVIVFSLTIALSKNSERTTRLIQEVGLLKQEIERLSNKKES